MTPTPQKDPAKIKAAQAAAKPIGFLDYLKAQLSIGLLETLGVKLVTYAEGKMPGSTGAEKKAWCVQQAVAVLEAFDDKIPVLGQWLDYPIADWLEEYAVAQLVEWAWLKAVGPTPPAKYVASLS